MSLLALSASFEYLCYGSNCRAQIRVRKCGIPAVFIQIPHISYHNSSVILRLDVDKIATEFFLTLYVSESPPETHIKNLEKSE